MFKCDGCGNSSKPREKMVRAVMSRREVRYASIRDAHEYKDKWGIKRVKDDPGGRGWEVVVEHKLCGGCANALVTPAVPAVDISGWEG